MNLLNLKSKPAQWFVLFLLAFTWGSSFILMKRGLLVYDYVQVAALRIFISCLILLPFVIKRLGKVKKRQWKYLFIVGLCGNTLPAFLFTKAQTEISSSLAGMLNSLVPLFTLLIGLLIFKTKILRSQVVGVFLGLAGAVGLITAGGMEYFGNNLSYGLFVIAATICYAISVNVIKVKLQDMHPLNITAIAFFLMMFPTGAYLLYSGLPPFTLSDEFIMSSTSIFVLAVFGTALAVIIFNALIKHTTGIFAASVTYIIPMVAMFWGVIDGEKLNIYHFISVIITLSGIYLVNKKAGS